MNKLTEDQEEKLEYWRRKIRNTWRIAEECERPCPEPLKVWEMVQLEMKFYCGDFVLGQTVASYAAQWVESRNPFYIDGAVYLCSTAGIEPPPALAALMAEVARRRFTGEQFNGTADQIDRETAKSQALTLMANLRSAGATMEDASSKAARFMADHYSGRPLKASSLQKAYTDKWRSLENALRKYCFEGSERNAEWRDILDKLPDADEELRGNRRD